VVQFINNSSSSGNKKQKKKKRVNRARQRCHLQGLLMKSAIAKAMEMVRANSTVRTAVTEIQLIQKM